MIASKHQGEKKMNELYEWRRRTVEHNSVAFLFDLIWPQSFKNTFITFFVILIYDLALEDLYKLIWNDTRVSNYWHNLNVS